MKTILTLVIAAAFSACGSGSERFDAGDAFIGYYEVSSHNKNLENCDSLGEAASEPIVSFELDFDQVSSIPTIRLTKCESKGKCDTNHSQFWKFTKRDELGWSGEVDPRMSGTKDECSVSAFPSIAVLDEKTLTLIKKTMLGIYPPPENKQCSNRGVKEEILEEFRDDFLCAELETVTAVKI